MLHSVRMPRLHRCAVFFLALAFLLPALAVTPALAAQEQLPVLPEVIQSNGKPYCIMVNRKQNTVTVYTTDASGNYTVPIRAMVCSTARAGYATAAGTFAVSDKYRWHLMEGDVYSQYACRFNRSMLFHSICYEENYKPNTLITKHYNQLGGPASMGCVRLQTIDAKWIYDNCDPGTIVKVYDDPIPGPLGKPEKSPASIPSSPAWDPTDPAPNNPYTYAHLSDLRLSRQELTLKSVSPFPLTYTTVPDLPDDLNVVWASSDPSVVTVDALGNLTAVGPGVAVVTATSGRIADRCIVSVPYTPIPFNDVGNSDWFLDDVAWSYQLGFIKGMGDNTFEPYGSVTQAQALQILYRTNGGTDTSGEYWYSAAQTWAENAGLISCFADQTFHPDQRLYRQEMANLLYYYEVHIAGNPSPASQELTDFADGDAVADFALDAVKWAAAVGIVKGDDGKNLLPYADIGRAQFAAMHRRFVELQYAKPEVPPAPDGPAIPEEPQPQPEPDPQTPPTDPDDAPTGPDDTPTGPDDTPTGPNDTSTGPNDTSTGPNDTPIDPNKP